SVPLFRDLPAPALEGIARALVREAVPEGTVLIREGDLGDRYYIVADGVAQVTQHGANVRVLHRSDGAGEIALIRDIPRTATVTAVSSLVGYRLQRQPCLMAGTGHVPGQRRAADGGARPTQSTAP